MDTNSLSKSALLGATLENFPLENPKNLFFCSTYATKIGCVGRAECGFLPLPIFPISLIAIFIKMDPLGKIFGMNIRRAQGVGNAVASGHHLGMQLRHQNRKLSTPSREKTPTEHQKHNNQHNNDVTSAFVSRSHLMQQRRSPPPRPTTPVPPQRPPQHTFNLG